MVDIKGCSSKNDILSDVEFILIIKNTIINMYGPLILNISGAIGNIQGLNTELRDGCRSNFIEGWTQESLVCPSYHCVSEIIFSYNNL